MTLREFRESNDLTLEQFAVKIGVCAHTLQRWERRKTRPGPLARRQLRQLGFSDVDEWMRGTPND